MTTQYKPPKDAKEAINLGTESATKMAEDAKFAVNEATSFAAKAAEDNQAFLTSNQKQFQESFEVWQNYTQASLEFALKATQQTIDQFFAFRQNLDTLAEESLKRNQALIEKEQDTVLKAFDAFQAQAKAASERVAKSFNISSQN